MIRKIKAQKNDVYKEKFEEVVEKTKQKTKNRVQIISSDKNYSSYENFSVNLTQDISSLNESEIEKICTVYNEYGESKMY